MVQINHIQHQLECIKVMLEIVQIIHRGGYQTFQLGYIIKNEPTERQRLYSRLLRKSGDIGDLFYSSKSKVAVEEELAQFNDILS